MADIPSGGGGAGGATGWIRIGDVTVSAPDVVDTKVYQDTGNSILQSCRSSTLSINVVLTASSPLVEVDGNAAELTLAADSGHYAGTVPVTLSGAGPVQARLTTPDDGSGALDTVTVAIEVPPVITALSFTGGYPGAQTEVAEGDTFDITVTADKSFNAVRIADSEAGDGDGAGGDEIVAVTPGLGPTVVSITVARRGTTPQALPAHVRVVDTLTGAFSTSRATDELGGSVDGTDVITLNDLHPTVDGFTKAGGGAPTSDTGHSFSTIVYPGSQQALKGSETADVTAVATEFDTILYDTDGTGELSPANPSTYASPKTVTRIGGSYNVTTDNYRITATRAANGAQIVVSGVVQIAHVATVATASFPGARIRSGAGSGEDTVITLSFDQNLLSAPSMDPAAGRGTFQGGGFTGAGSSWTRTLRVTDAENPADGSANSWLNLVATNLAGIVTSVITNGPTYVVGGFASRTLSFPPYLADSTETFPLTTEGNLSVGVFSNGNPGVIQPFGTGDTSDVGKEGWCAPDAASGTTVGMHMLHIPTASAHSGTLTLTLVEEAA